MIGIINFLVIAILITTQCCKNAYAIEDPLSIPNNKFGVHILFTTELSDASRLFNSNGGDWGYVTIPIQAGDRDLEKWQRFMDDARELHVIPIIRLASENYYFDTKVWRKSHYDDILDFANFLNSLEWPVKNRYIVVFNEVNRSDEWEGNLNPAEYANILGYAVSAFKSLNDDFFIISAGLDNAAPNINGKYMNEYDYMLAMNDAVPGIFDLVDGLGSHSYPNPGFRQMPYILTSQSIYSFNFERNLAYRLSGKNLPVFITETGWSKEELAENQIAEYFKYAFKHVWSDNYIVAVTPFLLQGGQGHFSQFSLINENGEKSKIFLALAKIPKTKGNPTVNYNTDVSSNSISKKLPLKTFPKTLQYKNIPLEKNNIISDFFKWLLRLSI
ncbi:MAG: hypothetical protein A3B47_02225 [Candidatus Levybacteria bacterium RIFCSPLOWO2_01_FULL_39_24]|nr:MAG: hypothetical protein A2800_01520 [Candidatus Levybacteria bacterium RIFCSPHIGHO2_01_FULL_40_16]OGH28692.1 MAG: hypothetical protein A3E12_00175 [Candidatus Levybacteria bacterium RIFCSPHIGHO2_12_FULL_39_9]OGH46455.1 MAG: hypothetical protein A3B47_02225 [Candidatus Levybacteria bacterium RIFCSPLOWO2_01_FULL_39_24]